jgi:hypothetical protein
MTTVTTTITVVMVTTTTMTTTIMAKTTAFRLANNRQPEAQWCSTSATVSGR